MANYCLLSRDINTAAFSYITEHNGAVKPNLSSFSSAYRGGARGYIVGGMWMGCGEGLRRLFAIPHTLFLNLTFNSVDCGAFGQLLGALC